MKYLLLSITLLMFNTLAFCQHDLPLLGAISRDQLADTPHQQWIADGYQAYHVKHVNINTKGIELKVFFGSWCGDSRREVPRLLKVMDTLGFKSKQLKLIAVDHTDQAYKKSPDHEEEDLNIYRVPSILVYKRGRLVNRIIERPKKSLEEDLAHIINGELYQPYYLFTLQLDNRLDESTAYLNDLTLGENLVSPYELISFARSKFADQDYQKALKALEFNLKVFPNYKGTCKYLGLTQLKLNNKNLAEKYFKDYLEAFPDDRFIIAQLQKCK